MTIRAISLDAAGTLIRPSEPVGVTYQKLAARHGIHLGVEQLGRGFADEFPRMPPLAFKYADRQDLYRQERDWWRVLVGRVVDRSIRSLAATKRAADDGSEMLSAAAEGPSGFDTFFDELYHYYSRPEAWTVYAEVLPMLEAAWARGLKLLVVSNFDSRLHTILEGLGIHERVDGVLCSSEAGAAKPADAIFFDALGNLGTDAGETLHVGDNRMADLHGARTAGLQALLVVRGAKPARHNAEIGNLAEILELCDKF